MLPDAPKPQLTPVLRHRMKEKFPGLKDEDLPLEELRESVLVQRIAASSGLSRAEVRRGLYEIGVLVRPRRVGVGAGRRADRTPAPEEEESVGSGVPDDTGNSGGTGLSPAW